MPVVALLGTFAGGDRTGFILFPVGRHESREDRKKPVRPVNWLRFPSWCSIRLFTVTLRCGTSHKSACPEEMAERDFRRCWGTSAALHLAERIVRGGYPV